MNIDIVIKFGYKIFIYSPYILTILFLIMAAFKFYNGDSDCMEYGVNSLIGFFSIISILICMNFLLPNMLISDSMNSFFTTVATYIMEISVTFFALVAITTDEYPLIKERIGISFIPVMFFGLFWIAGIMLK